jgi:hypothetical protein
MAEETGTPEAAIWATLKKGLPEDPHLPLLLAQTWGVVPEHFNALLLAEGYAWGDAWSDAFADDIAAARQRLAALAREPEPEPYVSVDSATTRDIDDAFFVTRTPGGGFRLRLALACPALTWDFGSPLDRAVRERASSIYLPEGTSHMLPEAYGLGLYSLDQGQPRPALVMDFTLDAAGALVCMQPRPAGSAWPKTRPTRPWRPPWTAQPPTPSPPWAWSWGSSCAGSASPGAPWWWTGPTRASPLRAKAPRRGWTSTSTRPAPGPRPPSANS